MAVIVTVWVVLRNVFTANRIRRVWRFASTRRVAAAVRVLFGRTMIAKVWPIAAAWGLGLALASPALLMFLDGYYGSTRAAGLPASEGSRWAVPVGAASGLVLPTTTTLWVGFQKPAIRDCFEVYGGFVPVVAVLAILIRSRLGFLRRHGGNSLSSAAWQYSVPSDIGVRFGGRSDGFLCSNWFLDSSVREHFRNGPSVEN